MIAMVLQPHVQNSATINMQYSWALEGASFASSVSLAASLIHIWGCDVIDKRPTYDVV